jgi:hypothetical protein
MGIRSLDITGVTIGHRDTKATGRITVVTLGNDRWWRAVFRVLALAELGSITNVDPCPVEIKTEQGPTLNGHATYMTAHKASADGRVWVRATGAGVFVVAG